jgi:hypothetical protein
MVELCPYIIISGARAGTQCNKCIRAKDSEYCYSHKGKSHLQEKYKNKLDYMKTKQSQFKDSYEEVIVLPSKPKRSHKKAYIKQLDESSDSESYEHTKKPKSRKKEDDDDRFLFKSFLDKKKTEIQKKNTIDLNTLNEEQLFDLLDTEVDNPQHNKKLINDIVLKLHYKKLISDEEQKGLLNKYCLK